MVINDNSAASQRIGEYYARQRGIPAENVVHIRTSEDETITRDLYTLTVERPLAVALTRGHLQDRILYLVLTKGVPIRINGTSGLNGTVGSVDSELTLLYRRMLALSPPAAGRLDNPYFLAANDIREAKRFSHRDYDIFLVSRLDAYTVDEALALVDRAKSAQAVGKFVLDERAALVNRTGDDWLDTAARRLADAGLGERVVHDTTPQGVRDVRDVLGYYSWGSNDPRNRVRSFGMSFAPGALAATFVSSDGRTFKPPPADWRPSDSDDKARWFAGTPQSLAADLIHDGATGVAGHVAEPYLQSTIRPEILFPAYVAGFNLVEAFYLAMPNIGWQTVVIGDPLCAPFARKSLTKADIEEPVDQATQLPGLFGGRRMLVASRQFPGVSESALKFTLKGEVELASNDFTGARASLEEATKLAPNVVPLELQLALVYETLGQADLAFERYQRVLEVQPRNPVALNNVAYGLAVRRNSPKDALPLAQQAVVLAPNDGNVIDTLAWVQHLLGDHTTAARTVFQATRRAPGNPELRLHAAIINAAAGAWAVAQNELDIALKLNSNLENREEVKQLKADIAKAAGTAGPRPSGKPSTAAKPQTATPTPRRK